MGHEIAGRIISDNNPALPPGTPVLIDPRLICSTCPQCTATADSADEEDDDNEPQSQGCAAGLSFVGFSTAVKGGGFAARVAVKANAVHVLPEWKGKDGEEKDLLADAALVEPLAVAWHAVKRAGVLEVPGWVGSGGGESGGKEGVKKGRKGKGKKKEAKDVAVLIVGGGPVGVAVAYVLRAWGVGNVVVSEPVAGRREHVKGLVDVVVDPVAESVVEKCKEVTGGRGVDVVFECAGSPRVVGDVFGSLAWRGVVVVVSLWVGEVSILFSCVCEMTIE